MPRAGLSTEGVVRAAAEVADRVGWDGLTAAAVAAHVGVRLPSLYNHVDGLPDLRRRLAAHAAGGLCAALQGTLESETPAAGRPTLAVLAHSYLGWAAGHPGTYPGTLRAPEPGDAEHEEIAARTVAVLRSALSGYGLTGSDDIHAIRLLRATLHGLVSLEQAHGFAMPEKLSDTLDFALAVLDEGLRRVGSR